MLITTDKLKNLRQNELKFAKLNISLIYDINLSNDVAISKQYKLNIKQKNAYETRIPTQHHKIRR